MVVNLLHRGDRGGIIWGWGPRTHSRRGFLILELLDKTGRSLGHLNCLCIENGSLKAAKLPNPSRPGTISEIISQRVWVIQDHQGPAFSSGGMNMTLEGKKLKGRSGRLITSSTPACFAPPPSSHPAPQTFLCIESWISGPAPPHISIPRPPFNNSQPILSRFSLRTGSGRINFLPNSAGRYYGGL